jgi:phosphatidylethanolamine/phosphatidyl-N-methylethanolamine N-methyltransferase
MRLNTNAWNRLRYTVWAPIYDAVVRPLERMRRESMQLVSPGSAESVLLVGAGTGKDLEYLAPGLRLIATDITAAMLERARRRARGGTCLAVMDGQALALRSDQFDVVVLHLIVAVIPDPVACLREAARVARKGGRIVIMDKFVRGEAAPWWLRLLNVPASIVGTELTRRFDEILEAAGVPLRIEYERRAALPLFWHIVLRKA